MKRYALFAGDNWYPAGGWKDFVQFYDRQDDAVRRGWVDGGDWWHVVDMETGDIVEKGKY